MMPKKTDCTCAKCQECCTREAGWFLPEEIPLAAKMLELTEESFIAKYCQQHNLNGKGIALSPKSKENSTICIFFENGLCKIHAAKPYECRKVFACEAPRKHKRTRELVAKKWC